jgi:uncharacterized protein
LFWPGQTELGPISLTVLTASLLTPEIIPVALDLWHFQPLRDITFQCVVFVLKVFGVEAIAKPSEYVLSSDSFSIRIDPACSGVEGFALLTFFLGCYFYAFKEDLRFPNAFVILPTGLLISWAFNVARIAVLFSIGTHGNPDLAVEGFHGHAGWLTFSILAFAIIGVSTSDGS